MASFLGGMCDRKTVPMLKLKLLFSIFIVIVFQQAILFSQDRKDQTEIDIESNLQVQFVADNDLPEIFDEVLVGRLVNTFSTIRTYCYFSSYKSKGFQKTLNNVNNFLKSTRNTIFVSANCSIIYIPLYLQTQNLLI